MKKSFTKFLIAAIVLSVASFSQAQSLKVSTGGSGGTYSRQTKELMSVCSSQIPITEINSTGSIQNLDRLIGNEVNGAFVQTDILFFRSRTEDLSNIKTLVAMNPEDVHVVALTQSKEKVGGTLGFGAKSAQINSVNDLGGKIVVAAGGSFVTAQIIRLQTEIPFQVAEMKSVEDALAAVASGQASAAVIVGGAPLGQISSLDRTFKLLSFPDATVAKLKNVYKSTRLNYGKMGAAGIQSVSTDSLFVTKNYTTQKYVDGLKKLRECIINNIPELAETTGMHPSFSKIDVTNHGKWAWFDGKAK